MDSKSVISTGIYAAYVTPTFGGPLYWMWQTTGPAVQEEGIEVAWNQVELAGDMEEAAKLRLFEEIMVLQALKHRVSRRGAEAGSGTGD